MQLESRTKNARFWGAAGLSGLAIALAWQAVYSDQSRIGHFLRGMLIGISIVFNFYSAMLFARRRGAAR